MPRKKLSLEGKMILTTNPEERIGLYAIRYLGRAGGCVSTISADPQVTEPLGFRSKYVKNKIWLPKDNFFNAFKSHLAKYSRKYDVINPIDVSTMLMVQDICQNGHIPCNYLIPKKETLIVADNKELLTQHAQRTGLKCPESYFRISPDDVASLSHSELTYPCIIKFRGADRASHWEPDQRYRIVSSPQELVTEYRRMHHIEPYPIIQEYISGQGFGYFALYDKSKRLKAQFCHRRIREYPIAGGPSSCCESYYDADLVAIGKRLLESLEWTGLAMVEFKYDRSRKRLYIIEVNPRYWGSLPLAVHSGVNFPVLHILSALEEDYEPVVEYTLKTRVRFLDKDARSIFSGIRLERSWLKKIRLFLEIFDIRVKDGLIALDDMRPVLSAILDKFPVHSRT